MTTTDDYTGALPTGWTGGQHLSKWWRGKIIHLYTLRRACAECGSEMRIDVTRAALEGKAKNAGMHLKRCASCRAKARALGASSRPRVEGEVIPRRVSQIAERNPPETDEELLTANATMKEELAVLYDQNKQLRDQNKELRDRLAKYELAPALEAVAGRAPRMPWEH